MADAETRTAFVHTLRSVVDVAGQRVSAADRLYLAAEMPTLIIWGDHDHIIPVEQGQRDPRRDPGQPARDLRRHRALPALRAPRPVLQGARGFHEHDRPVDDLGHAVAGPTADAADLSRPRSLQLAARAVTSAYWPNQRARRVAPKSFLAAASASEGSLKMPDGAGPLRKSTSNFATSLPPNSM